jgi:hypothetical protein
MQGLEGPARPGPIHGLHFGKGGMFTRKVAPFHGCFAISVIMPYVSLSKPRKSPVIYQYRGGFYWLGHVPDLHPYGMEALLFAHPDAGKRYGSRVPGSF